jgi:hypothetical protein
LQICRVKIAHAVEMDLPLSCEDDGMMGY